MICLQRWVENGRNLPVAAIPVLLKGSQQMSSFLNRSPG